MLNTAYIGFFFAYLKAEKVQISLGKLFHSKAISNQNISPEWCKWMNKLVERIQRFFCIFLYFVFIFILRAISPCTTGLTMLYMTHSTAQVQSNSQIPLIERQKLKDDHLSTSLRLNELVIGEKNESK